VNFEVKVGFTGTQEGMTDEQKVFFKSLMREYQPTEFHHGDCIGSDTEAHDIVWDLITLEGMNCKIVVHPPEDESKRAFAGDQEIAVVVLPPKPYINRNHDIVNATDILVATPRQFTEVVRSGTWATIRYARKSRGGKVMIVRPDGVIKGRR
jgi:hypothetical protein